MLACSRSASQTKSAEERMQRSSSEPQFRSVGPPLMQTSVATSGGGSPLRSPASGATTALGMGASVTSASTVSLRSLDSRPHFSRPSETDVLGQPRLKPIRVRMAQRSRMKDANDVARTELAKITNQLQTSMSAGEYSETAYTQKMSEADARFRLKKLKEAMSRKTATEERIVSLKRTMKEFLKSHGTDSARELKRAFSVADVDHSGELDYNEFKNAVQNYGLRQLSSGSLRTLFDSFDEDTSGSISHAEFVRSLKNIPEGAPSDEGGGVTRRSGPLVRVSILEPRRVGYEATPPILQLGRLHVGVAYQTTLNVLNTGDTDLRLTVKLNGFDGARDKNPVRVVARPHGPLAPGLRAKVVCEILVRAPGDLSLQVMISSGSQVLDVPLSAVFVRRDSVRVPMSSMEDGQSVSSPLPKYVRRLTTRRDAPPVVARACARGVWPSLHEQWTQIQQQTGEASQLLSEMAALRTCPHNDLNSVSVRLKRFRARANTKLIVQGDAAAKRQMLFVASGVGDVYIELPNSSEPLHVLTIRAPFYIGEGSVISKEVPSATVVATTDCEGFSLAENEAEVLIGKNNMTLSLIRRDMLQRKFERTCAAGGGLLKCNFTDSSFVEALLEYARSETRHESKALFMCRHLSFESRCANIERALGPDAHPAERGLRFDNCLVLCDEIWKDFIRPPVAKGSTNRVKGRSVLGNNLVPDERVKEMLEKRHAARIKSDISMLAKIYEELADDVDVVLKRAVLTDFVTSPRYKEWLALKFPIIQKSESAGSGDEAEGGQRRPSIDFDLPALRRRSVTYARGKTQTSADLHKAATTSKMLGKYTKRVQDTEASSSYAHSVSSDASSKL